jgi:hypothetical protein
LKKELIVFFSNVIALFAALGIAMNLAPLYASG